jgi:hypothetical protein
VRIEVDEDGWDTEIKVVTANDAEELHLARDDRGQFRVYDENFDPALEQLRAAGHPVADEDVARLSPFIRKHLHVLGAYSFSLPDMPGGLRELRDPDTLGEEDD